MYWHSLMSTRRLSVSALGEIIHNRFNKYTTNSNKVDSGRSLQFDTCTACSTLWVVKYTMYVSVSYEWVSMSEHECTYTRWACTRTHYYALNTCTYIFACSWLWLQMYVLDNRTPLPQTTVSVVLSFPGKQFQTTGDPLYVTHTYSTWTCPVCSLSNRDVLRLWIVGAKTDNKSVGGKFILDGQVIFYY